MSCTIEEQARTARAVSNPRVGRPRFWPGPGDLLEGERGLAHCTRSSTSCTSSNAPQPGALARIATAEDDFTPTIGAVCAHARRPLPLLCDMRETSFRSGSAERPVDLSALVART